MEKIMDVLEAVRERRSINLFDTERLISIEVLQQLFDLANLAPSSFNLQPWSVVVVQDPSRKKELRRFALDQSKIEEAPLSLIIVADPDVNVNLHAMLDSWEELGYIRTEKRAEIEAMVRRRYGAEDSEQRKLFAVKNAALFSMNLMIAAKGLGLDTHAIDGFDEGPMKTAFGIPEGKIVPMIIAVGYMSSSALMLPRAFRRSFREFVSFDYYSF